MTARVNVITSAQEAQKEVYDHAQLGGSKNKDGGSELHENIDEDGKLENGELVRDVKTCMERSIPITVISS